MVAGVAAGMAAVFRTPLGAALLAVEVLYRDDFESDALVPAVLASVIAYSVVISIFGESTLFARAPRYPFIPAHLPLYALLALLRRGRSPRCSLSTLRAVQKRVGAAADAGLGAPRARRARARARRGAAHPARRRAHRQSRARALGILGGGYGAAQIAITGRDWLPAGWTGVELLLLLCVAKLLATSFTIGTGGSAGDFAPVAGAGRPLRRRLRPRRAARCCTTRASIPARSRSSGWARSTAASRTCPSARWSWSASSPAATTCSCR